MLLFKETYKQWPSSQTQYPQATSCSGPPRAVFVSRLPLAEPVLVEQPKQKTYNDPTKNPKQKQTKDQAFLS